jgi:hypothetical protein
MHNESLHGIGGKLPRLPMSSDVRQEYLRDDVWNSLSGFTGGLKPNIT